jgi:hypothetical protein
MNAFAIEGISEGGAIAVPVSSPWLKIAAGTMLRSVGVIDTTIWIDGATHAGTSSLSAARYGLTQQINL